jgi:amino-acid N-acetyltransferase
MDSSASSFAIAPVAASDTAAAYDLLRRSRLPLAGLEDHLETLLVARADGRVIGTAALEVYADGVLLRSVAVDPAYQGRGLGRALTAAALDLARRQGAPLAYLLTETADAFFGRLGFRPVSRGDVAPGVQGSVEFTTACPASARVMLLDLA